MWMITATGIPFRFPSVGDSIPEKALLNEDDLPILNDDSEEILTDDE
jgi:hypothetical protein